MNRIVKVELKKNVRIKNLHNNIMFPLQDVMIIHYENGNKSILDLFSEYDITDIKYYELVETTKTKTKELFKELVR